MTQREQVEYSALRATIRERGSTRVYVFVLGVAAWGALAIATAVVASTPLATIVPLVVLAAVFEAVFALHVGVERVGRYLQVFYETDGTDAAGAGWEHAAMAFGRPRGAATSDPLFAVVFLIATFVNAAPALIVEPTMQEMIFVGGAHALFLVRLFAARDAASKQRAIDLARFTELRNIPEPRRHEDPQTRS